MCRLPINRTLLLEVIMAVGDRGLLNFQGLINEQLSDSLWYTGTGNQATTIGSKSSFVEAASGAALPWTMELTDAFASGSGSAGFAVGFYDSVAEDRLWQVSDANPATFTLSGLDSSNTYDVIVEGARDLVANKATDITLNGVIQTLNAGNNGDPNLNITTFSGVSPVSGVITIDVEQGAASTGGGFINVLEIIDLGPSATAPALIMSPIQSPMASRAFR